MQEDEEGEKEEEDEQSEEEGEKEEEAKKFEKEEMEQQEVSPLQDPLGEDELAKVLVNMGEYGQPSSPSDLHAEEKTQEENAPKESHAKEAEEGNFPAHDKNMIGDVEQEQFVPS